MLERENVTLCVYDMSPAEAGGIILPAFQPAAPWRFRRGRTLLILIEPVTTTAAVQPKRADAPQGSPKGETVPMKPGCASHPHVRGYSVFKELLFSLRQKDTGTYPT